ncbi:MAG: hypothetical protein V4650_08475 [Pseudomonadota bacterium]
MTINEKQHAEIQRLATKAELLGLNAGLFRRGGKSAEEQALKAWRAGYIAVPTVDCLLKEIEIGLDEEAAQNAAKRARRSVASAKRAKKVKPGVRKRGKRKTDWPQCELPLEGGWATPPLDPLAEIQSRLARNRAVLKSP